MAAAGSKVRGRDRRTYLDCGGYGVSLLGHCHPVVLAPLAGKHHVIAMHGGIARE